MSAHSPLTQHEIHNYDYLGYQQPVVILEIVKLYMKNK